MASEQELSDFLKSVEKRAFKRALYAVRDDEAALDIVQDGISGRLVGDRSARGLAAALGELPRDPDACRAAGTRFGEEHFSSRLAEILDAYAPVASTAATARSSGLRAITAPAAARAASLARAQSEDTSSERTAAT